MKPYELSVIIIGWFLEEIKEVKNGTEFQKLQDRRIFANENVVEKRNFLYFDYMN